MRGKKCIVRGCKSNYNESRSGNEWLKDRNNKLMTTKVPVFGFPNKAKHLEERVRWIKSIPYITKDQVETLKNPYICIKHWPIGFETKKGEKGRDRPKHPPTIFSSVPPSAVPTPLPKERVTKRSLLQVKSIKEDEIKKLLQSDQLDFEQLKSTVHNRKFGVQVTCFIAVEDQWIQSNDYIEGIPKFSLKVLPDLSFTAYSMGIVNCGKTSFAAKEKLDCLTPFDRL